MVKKEKGCLSRKLRLSVATGFYKNKSFLGAIHY